MHGLLELSPDLAPLAEQLADALRRVERVFDDQLRSDLPAVSRLVGHVGRYRGKMLRPVMVLLSGLAAHPRGGVEGAAERLSDAHWVVAAVCEMVHMATLVHDDVLDEADTRRRGSTVNRLHGNEAAVILGDYLIASAYHLCSTLPSPRAARRIGRASTVVCSGELLQLHHRGDLSLDAPTYFEIIDRKTAELIAASAELGAACSGADDATCARFERFGRESGIAFQIQDDLLDLLGQESVVGKSVAKDVEKGKMTLPMIHHLARAGARERGEAVRLIESLADHATPELVGDLRRRLDSTGSVEYARASASDRIGSAKAVLAPLPDSAAKRMLLAMADAVLARAF